LTYLAILIDRIAAMSTSFGLWKDNLEAIVTPFSRQAIPIVFDFPEVNIFSNSTGSSLNQLDWIIRYVESESSNEFHSILKNASSGEKSQFEEKALTAVITDPPYYDAIAYADISDFFYVWLKRTISDIYPLNFSTPQTPKSDECTALKHHHAGSIEKAKEHNNRLTQTINENGELVSIQNMNTQEKNLGVNATIDEIKHELFEGDNIVMDKNSDHGLAELMK
jgi:adenine-specific DNA methylase